MKDKPYLISIHSETPGVQRYIDSLPNLGDSVELAYVELDKYPGHLYRWDYLPKDLNKDRWWIFTDTADVIFQAPIPDLDATGKDILPCFEGVGFKDNGFWRAIIEELPAAKGLLESPIFNMGAWAMKGREADKMLFYLKAKREEFKYHQHADQLIYNLWLNQVDPKKIGVHPTLFTCLYANYDLGNVQKVNGQFVNPKGQLFSVVHANGSCKHLLEDE